MEGTGPDGRLGCHTVGEYTAGKSKQRTEIASLGTAFLLIRHFNNHAGSFLFWVLRGMRVYGTCLTSPGRTQGENSSSVASQCALCAPYCNTHLVPLGQRTRINSDWHLRACSTVR